MYKSIKRAISYLEKEMECGIKKHQDGTYSLGRFHMSAMMNGGDGFIPSLFFCDGRLICYQNLSEQEVLDLANG